MHISSIIFLFFSTLSAQTLSWSGCGPTYGTKPGVICGVSFPIPGGMNQFDVYEVKINAKTLPITTVGFGISKIAWTHNFTSGKLKGWTFDFVTLTSVGASQSSTANSVQFNGGFLPTMRKGHLAFSFGYVAQSGIAKGNLYGLPIGYLP